MKIKEGLYYCEWCSTEFEKVINRTEGQGRKGVGVDQCICTNCGRKVSQKTKIEREYKLTKGQRV